MRHSKRHNRRGRSAVLAASFIAFASPAFAECAAGYTQITVPLCAPVTDGVTATPANTFLNTLGANIHISQGFAEAAYEPEFTYTGIRNARDFYVSSSLVTLHNNTVSSTYPGVKMDILADAPSTIVSETVPLANAGALVSIEGPNEPNNFPITYGGNLGGGTGTWVPVAQFQRDLYTAVKGNSTLAKYPVFNSSEDGGETDNVGLQCNALNSSCPGASAVALMPAGTVYADYVNPHNYVQGNGGCATATPNQAWNAEDPLLNSCWDGLQTEYVHTWAGNFAGYSTAGVANVPRVTSETGWGSSTIGSTLDYQGKIITLIYLDGYKRGWAYTFIYEMVDQQGSIGDQGLYDTTNTAKPAATFVHNMTTILQDTTDFTPGQLNYSIANEPATVHDMLLQKSNGTFYLAIWDEQTSTSTTDSITVTLGAPRTVTEYDTTVGTTSVATFTNTTSIPLTLSDHAVFLAIP